MLQHIFVRALIVEGDVVELHKPFDFFRQVPGLGRVLHAAFAGKDIRDAARRDGGAGDHHEHHADHEEAHNDLHGVLDEGHHVAHLHGGIRDLVAADPYDQQRNAVHYQHHHRHHRGHGAEHEQVVVGKVLIGFVEAFLFKILRGERADDHHA